MATKLVDCEHCHGKKTCTASAGRSCRACLEASGLGRRHFAAVRCSYCGGRGRVWVEAEEVQSEGSGEEGAGGEGEEPQGEGEAAGAGE